MSILYWLVVGVAAGWLAGVLTGTNRGIVGDLILGLVGAFVAGLVTDAVGGNLIVTIIVAAIFAAISFITSSRLTERRPASLRRLRCAAKPASPIWR